MLASYATAPTATPPKEPCQDELPAGGNFNDGDLHVIQVVGCLLEGQRQVFRLPPQHRQPAQFQLGDNA
jgi:hypothetical protein